MVAPHRLLAALFCLVPVGLFGCGADPVVERAKSGASTDNGGSANLSTIPMLGCFHNDYTAVMTTASGGSFNLLVDTGSMATAIAGSTCSNCSGIAPVYSPGASAKDLNKSVEEAYGGLSSWKGEAYSDAVSFGNAVKNVPLAFAAITSQSTDSVDGSSTAFFNQSLCSGNAVNNSQQGILGLGTSKLGPPELQSLPDQIAATGLASIMGFQFCDIGGRMWFGGYDGAYTAEAPLYIPMDESTGFYLVELLDIKINGQSVGAAPNNFGRALVDTGTSINLVTQEVGNALSAALDADAGFVAAFGTGFMASGTCQNAENGLERAALEASLPTFTMVFGDGKSGTIEIDVPATNAYLSAAKAPNGATVYCPAITAAFESGTGVAILGNSIMHHHVTIIDRAQARLGFARQRGCTTNLP